MYAHSVYGYYKGKWQRFFHEKSNGNIWADNYKVVELRFTVAKSITKNIIAHYLEGENGHSGDFYCNLYNEKKFKVYNFYEYAKQAGNTGMAEIIKKYSKTY